MTDPDRRLLLRILALWPLSLGGAAGLGAGGGGRGGADRAPTSACSRRRRPRGRTTSIPSWCAPTSPRGCRGRRCGSRCRWWTKRAGRSRGRGWTSGTATRRELLGLRPAGERQDTRHPRRDLHARHAVRRRGRGGHVPHRLARLVPGPDAARPLQGLPRRDHAADQPALLPRRRQRDRVPRRGLPEPRRGPGHHQRQRRHRPARRPARLRAGGAGGGGWRAELVVGVAAGGAELTWYCHSSGTQA